MGVEQTLSTEADRWILSTYNKTTYQDIAGKREGTIPIICQGVSVLRPCCSFLAIHKN
jgi:hypothetical protein